MLAAGRTGARVRGRAGAAGGALRRRRLRRRGHRPAARVGRGHRLDGLRRRVGRRAGGSERVRAVCGGGVRAAGRLPPRRHDRRFRRTCTGSTLRGRRARSSISGRWAPGWTSWSRRWTACGPGAWRCTRRSTWCRRTTPTVEAGGTVFYRRRGHRGIGASGCGRPAMTSTWTTRWVRRPEDLHVDVPPVLGRAPAHGAGRLRDDVAGADRDEGRIGPRGSGTGRGRVRRRRQPLTRCSRRPLSRLWIAFVFS